MAYLAFVPPGVVFPFAGATAPDGWLLCNGSAISRTVYASLFAAIASAHGSGDGSTTFNLPDYRGRIMRGRDGGVARDPDRASRTAAAAGGNTGDNVGSVQVQATKIPTTAFTTASQALASGSAATGVNLAHGHSVTDSGHVHTLQGGGGAGGVQKQVTIVNNAGAPAPSSQSGVVDSTTTGISIQNSSSLDHSHSVTGTCPASTVNGGGDAETRPINAYVNYIIKI